MISAKIKRNFKTIIFGLFFTNFAIAQSIFPNSDFEIPSTTCNCTCADSYICDNNAGWTEQGVAPLHAPPFSGGCFNSSSVTSTSFGCPNISYSNRLGAHSGVGYIHFYAGGDKVTTPDTTFATCRRLEICVWYCGPQDSAAVHQNDPSKNWFRLGRNGVGIGSLVRVPKGTLWTKHCVTIDVNAGVSYNFNILAGVSGAYNFWFDDFEVKDITHTLDPTITPAGPYCVTDAGYKNLSAIDEGTWSSNTPGFFLSTTAGGFRPSLVGAGTHRVYNTECNGKVDSIDIVILPIPDATITSTGPYCLNDTVIDLTAVQEGIWSGAGIINSTTGSFDPSLAGAGTHRIINTITGIGSCSDIDTIDITINLPVVFNRTIPSICDSALVNGNWYYTSQLVRDTITSGASNGCDSIVNTSLTIINSTTSSINVSLCNSNFTSPSGAIYSVSGIYQDTILNNAGCDSVITINFSKNPIPITNLNPPAICDSALVNGNWYYSSQTVRDTLLGVSSEGCDSIVNTNLVIINSSFSSIIETTCNSNYVSPSGKTITTTGTYLDTILNSIGCDSIITINFTRFPIPVTNLNPTQFCDSAQINGTWFYTSQIVRDTITGGASSGCDSIVNTNLIINYSSYITLNPAPVCDSTSVNGNWYFSSQIVRDTLIGASSNGCDSIVTTNLLINQKTQSTLNPSLCNTNYTSPSGKTFTTTGTYYDTIPNTDGCDSLITINLIISSSVYTTLNPPAACDSIFTYGNWYYTSQTLRDTIFGGSSLGCDSITNTVLIINNSSSSTVNVNLCNSNYTSPSGKIYTNTGNYQDTIPNNSGCDSLITINFTKNISPITNLSPPQICDSALVNGNWYFTSQLVRDTIFGGANNGCDSIVNTTLIISNSSSSLITVNLCNSSFTSPSGKVFTVTGIYQDTILNSVGCDSLITIDFTNNSIPITNQSPPSFCDSAQVNGNWYYTSQVVRDTLIAAASNGCDSIINTNLIIFNSSYTNLNPPQICDSAQVNGNWYFSSQTVRDTLIGATSNGCDSIVNTNLIINNSSSSFISETTCALNYISPSGKILSTSGVYQDTIPNSSGCDSTITINLTINTHSITNLNPNPVCDSIQVNGNWYYTSQMVRDTLFSGASNGCDSIVNTNLSINYATYSTLNLTNCNSSYTSPSGKIYSTTGTYQDTISNNSGCDSLITINFTNHPVPKVAYNPSPSCDSALINGNWYFSSQVIQDTLVGGSSTGCDSIVITNLVIVTTRYANILDARDLCSKGSPVNFSSSSPGGSWSGGNINSTTGLISPSSLVVGIYNIKYQLAGLCVVDDSTDIEVYEAPEITYITKDDECKEGIGSIDVTIDGGFAPISYLWGNGDTTQNLQSLTQGTYLLSIIDFYGCTDMETITINSITTDDCFANLFIPNSFTPDDDGVNDVFRVVGQHITDYNLKIFNRWGELLYESNDLTKAWDGKYKNEFCKNDMYVWKVSYSTKFNERFEKHGHIMLMR